MIVRIKTFLSVYICTLHLISNFISIILYIICVSLLSEIERNKPFEHGIVVSLYFNMKCKLSIPSHRSKKKRMYTRISTKSESFPLQDALFWEIFSFFFCIFRSLAFFFNRCLDTSQVLSSNVNYERNAKNKRKANVNTIAGAIKTCWSPNICTADQMLFWMDRCDLDKITIPKVRFISEMILFRKLLCKNQALLYSNG